MQQIPPPPPLQPTVPFLQQQQRQLPQQLPVQPAVAMSNQSGYPQQHQRGQYVFSQPPPAAASGTVVPFHLYGPSWASTQPVGVQPSPEWQAAQSGLHAPVGYAGQPAACVAIPYSILFLFRCVCTWHGGLVFFLGTLSLHSPPEGMRIVSRQR